MNLKEYNVENVVIVRTTTPAVHINIKTGLFNFSRSACELIGLKANDQIKLHQDQSDPENWYVEKVKQGGFALRASDASGKGLYLNNTQLGRMIFNSVECEKESGRILIAGKPTEFEKRKLWGLLVVSLNKEAV